MSLLRVFLFLFFFFQKNKCYCAEVVGGTRLLKLWDSGPEGPFSSLRTLTNGPNELWTVQETEPPWYKPMVVNGTVVGPFEEEEEGTGVASDVVKVEGEDPATPGLMP